MNLTKYFALGIASTIASILFLYGSTAYAQVTPPTRGGTGTSSIPAPGDVLIGQPNGSYAPQATSTLGFAAPFTPTYPLSLSGGILSLLFGTSTSNAWGGTQTFANAPILGSLTGFIKANGGALATALIDLTSDVAGVLSIANGGTNASSQTATGIAYFDGSKITTSSGLAYVGGKVGIGTAAPTNALTFPAGSSGIAMYFGADQTVNYERAFIDFSSGPRFMSQAGGTGIARNLIIGQASGSTQLTFSNSFGAVFTGNAASASYRGLNVAPTLSTTAFSTDAVGALDVRPVINQAGTAAFTGLRIQPTINTTGSGTSYLAQIGTSASPSLFVITPAGNTGIGTTTPNTKLSVYGGGLSLDPGVASRPTCDVSNRGMIWNTFGGAGVADTSAICRKDAADAYGWTNF